MTSTGSLRAAVCKTLLFALFLYSSKNDKLPDFLSRRWTQNASVSYERILEVLWVLSIMKDLKDMFWSKGKGGWNREKEVVVVTGGSSGIGESIVKNFEKMGVKVVILDLNAPGWKYGPNVTYHQTDVTSPDSITAASSAILSSLGQAPTILINNAGTGTGLSILSSTPSQISTTIAVNLTSHFFTVQAFLPAMIEKNHGHVVTVASVASFVTLAQNVDYSATKAGLVSFHEGLRQELDYRYKAKGVKTTIIHPNWVRTPMTTKLLDSSTTSLPAFLEPQYIADAIVNQVVSGENGRIILPKRLWIVTWLRGFPYWFQEMVRGSQQGVVTVGQKK